MEAWALRQTHAGMKKWNICSCLTPKWITPFLPPGSLPLLLLSAIAVNPRIEYVDIKGYVVYTQRLHKSGWLLLKHVPTCQVLFSFLLRLNLYSLLGMSLNKNDDNGSGIPGNELQSPPLQSPGLGQQIEPQAVSCIKWFIILYFCLILWRIVGCKAGECCGLFLRP